MDNTKGMSEALRGEAERVLTHPNWTPTPEEIAARYIAAADELDALQMEAETNGEAAGAWQVRAETAERLLDQAEAALRYTREHLVFDPETGEAVDVLYGEKYIGQLVSAALTAIEEARKP